MNDPAPIPIENDSDEGRILALDLGEKRIGVAVSDETRTIARSVAVVNRQARRADFRRINELVEQHKVSLLVVGLPLLASGEEGDKAAWVRDYASDLQRNLGLDLKFWDESFTTVKAEASLRERGIRGRRRRQRVDAVAAAFILQSYLDALRTADQGASSQ
ncbi:MAG: Holliday junction resolvase RuvX [Chloroflexota bacterium]|nr:MAG: Holliday junction resolvase RuvX [Chloroflexota bacterium]